MIIIVMYKVSFNKEEIDMPLMIAPIGEEFKVKKITGTDETKKFLNKLGFVVGEPIKIISELGGNMIINVKDTRVALDKSIASRILV